VACSISKTAISLKCVKIEEKLLWRAYRKSPTLFRTVPSTTPYGLRFPKIGDSQPHPKTAIGIISGTAKATDCKFGRYVHMVHANKSHLNFGRKWSVGVSRDCPNLVPPIISGTGKATNFKFCTHILSIDQNKSPLQISGKVAGCIVRTLKTFNCTYILGASRGLLCDSSAVLLIDLPV